MLFTEQVGVENAAGNEGIQVGLPLETTNERIGSTIIDFHLQQLTSCLQTGLTAQLGYNDATHPAPNRYVFSNLR